MDQNQNRTSGGFTIIEFLTASVVLVIGIMGFAGAIVSAQLMARATKENNLANAAVVSAVEGFRRSCIQNFDSTLTTSIGKTTFFRERIGVQDVDIGVREIAGSGTPPSAPVIPGSVPLAAGTKTVVVDSDGNTIWTIKYTDPSTSTEYSLTKVSYLSGKVSTLETRLSPDGSTATSARTVAADGKTSSVYYASDGVQLGTVYSSIDDAGNSDSRIDAVVYGVSSVRSSDYSEPLFLSTDNMIDFATLSKVGRDVRIDLSVLVDETTIDPPIDLNGDGDYLDSNLTAAEVRAAVLRFVVTWNGVLGPRTIEYSTIMAKGEM